MQKFKKILGEIHYLDWMQTVIEFEIEAFLSLYSIIEFFLTSKLVYDYVLTPF
jgi:hypothetical protein